MRQEFESGLYRHWQNRDFAAWNQLRGVYADWLGDRMDPLWYFASLPWGGHQAGHPGKRPWIWRLRAQVEQLPPLIYSWKHRVNLRSLLGVPPTCFKFTGFSGDGIDGNRESGPYALRFTIVFRSRESPERIEEMMKNFLPQTSQRQLRDALGITCKFDAAKHPLGLAAMLLPSEAGEYVHEGLFEGL